MTDVIDTQSLIESAEQAARRGDFEAAQAALRRVLVLQKHALGPAHPELASTLNNLAIVYERLERAADAEHCYRRSYQVARAALPPDDPMVLRSAENLRAFCAARGLGFEDPTEPATPAAAPIVLPQLGVESAATAPAPPRAVPSTPPAAIEVAPQAASSTWILAAVIALVLLVTVALFVRSRYRYASESSAPPSPQSTPAATTTPSPSPPPSPAARPESAARAPEIPSAPAPPVVAAPAPKPARPAGAQSAEVLDARLCSALDLGENWRCAPVEGSVTDGAVFFVTRIRSTADATIEHRWYRGDRLHQSVTLHIRPLAGGYRTYSRMTVNSERAGNWRVELRSSDGTVLDSKQFTVAR